MKNVLAKATPDGAKVLMSESAINGERFRRNCDIIACAENPSFFMKMIHDIAETEPDTYLVFASVFVDRNECETFNVCNCLPGRYYEECSKH